LDLIALVFVRPWATGCQRDSKPRSAQTETLLPHTIFRLVIVPVAEASNPDPTT
jgi:hypothetical protein